MKESLDTTKRVEEITELLKKIPQPVTAIHPDAGDEYLPGQIWETNSKDMEFPFVMILEVLEKAKTYNIAPVFRWTEMAGPEDLFLPKNYCGTPMIISFELEFSASTEILLSCKGRLEMEALQQILSARKDLANNDKSKISKHTWGWEYLDEYDNRYLYHERLAATIETLQGSLKLEFPESITEQELIIPFPPTEDVALAAKKESSRTVSFTTSVNVVVTIAELSGTDRYTVQIYDENDKPSNTLDGYKIVGQDKKPVATITNANAEFPKSYVENGLFIMNGDGEIIALTPRQK